MNKKIRDALKVVVAIAVFLIFMTPSVTVSADTSNIMEMEHISGRAGDTGLVIYINGTWNVTLGGYSIAMCYDSTNIEIDECTFEGTVGETADVLQDCNILEPGVLIGGAAWSSNPAPTAGSGILLKLVINITEDAANGETVLDLTDNVGSPPVSSIFVDPGGFTIPSELVDGVLTISGGVDNRAPNKPSNPFPEDEETNVDINKDLTWTGGDPDIGDTVTYDVYFGTNLNPSDLVGSVEDVPATQTTITYDLETLEFGTTYYWKIVARDNSGTSNSGSIWSFTTEVEGTGDDDTGDDDTGDDDTGDDDTGDDDDVEKMPPVADANGPYPGLINQNITFDGSGSYASDGTISNFSWDFGDGNTSYGMKPVHVYTTNGTYTVTLTVIDSNGLADTDGTTAYISNKDSDGDGWGDEEEERYGTDPNNSTNYPLDTDNDHVPDSEDTDDDNDGLSDSLEVELGSDPKNMLDVKTVDINDVKHFLVDTDGDSKSDIFYNSTSGKTTQLDMYDDTQYLIDEDGDGNFDYIYNPSDGTITSLEEEKKDGTETSKDLGIPMGVILVIAMVLIVIAVIVFLYKKEYF